LREDENNGNLSFCDFSRLLLFVCLFVFYFVMTKRKEKKKRKNTRKLIVILRKNEEKKRIRNDHNKLFLSFVL